MEGCSNSLMTTLVVLALTLPIQYYISDIFYAEDPKPIPKTEVSIPPNASWVSLSLPTLDIIFTIILFAVVNVTYICDLIQRKLMERRIRKLNRYLSDCADRLRLWDTRQEKIESTIKMVQNATSEYNLLLYLLLRQHRLGPTKRPPSNFFFDKDLDDLNFATNPTIEIYQDQDQEDL